MMAPPDDLDRTRRELVRELRGMSSRVAASNLGPWGQEISALLAKAGSALDNCAQEVAERGTP